MLNNRTKKILEIAGDWLHSLAMIIVIGTIIYAAYRGYAALVTFVIPDAHWKVLLSFWVVVGAIGTVYWPWKYRENMTGLWGSYVKWHFWTPITGPFAFLLSFPL